MNMIALSKWTVHLLMKSMFVCWASQTKDEKIQDLSERTEALARQLGKKAESIWLMNKQELVQLGLKELGKSREELEKMRKGELQHKIKTKRDEDQGVKKVNLPKGLSRMTHQELLNEAQQRGVDTGDEKKRYGMKVREQLIADIKAYEEARAELTGTFPDRTAEDDFLMTDSADGWQQAEASGGASRASSNATQPSNEEVAAFARRMVEDPAVMERVRRALASSQ